jgi:hypothetical protein
LSVSIGWSDCNLDFEELAENGFGFSAALDYTELKLRNGLSFLGLPIKGFTCCGFACSFSNYLFCSVLVGYSPVLDWP